MEADLKTPGPRRPASTNTPPDADPELKEGRQAQSTLVFSPRPPGPGKRKAGLFGRLRYGLHFVLDPIGFVAGRFERFGDVYFVASDDQPGLYVIKDPELCHQVLVTKAKSFGKKHSAFEMLSDFLGHGLLTTEGDTWRRQRRLVQPAFSKARLKGYATIMTEEAERQVRHYQPGQVSDVSHDMMENDPAYRRADSLRARNDEP